MTHDNAPGASVSWSSCAEPRNAISSPAAHCAPPAGASITGRGGVLPTVTVANASSVTPSESVARTDARTLPASV